MRGGVAGKIKFRPSAADFAFARRDIYRQCVRTWPLLLVYSVVPAVFFVLGLLDGGGDPARMAGYAVGYGLIGLLLSGAMIAISWVLIPVRSRRLFRQTKLLHQEFHYSWSEAGLRFASATGSGEIPWAMLHGWVRGRANVLIYASPAMCHFLPLRLLDEGSLGELERTITGAGVRRL